MDEWWNGQERLQILPTSEAEALADFLKKINDLLKNHPTLTASKREALKAKGARLLDAYVDLYERHIKLNSTHDVMYKENGRLERALHQALQKAKTNPLDSLAGLPGKKEFIRQVASHLKRENREHVCVVIVFDVKDFKDINNNIGHAMGDKVILKVAEILKATMRAESRKEGRTDYPDLIARHGGDEFGVRIVLNDGHRQSHESYEDVALGIVERCCAEFAAVKWPDEYRDYWVPLPGKNSAVFTAIKPTLNPGVVVIHAGPRPRVIHSARPATEVIMHWADGLMYESKAYEKAYGRRRIFYKVAKFHERQITEVLHSSYEARKA
jgi:diguanylate cyclase (GGDEF)-like protein